MIKIFMSLTTNTAAKLEGRFNDRLSVGGELSLMLPYDDKEKKEALLWLATQLEQEARKL